MSSLDIIERGSDKIMYLPAFSLAFLSTELPRMEIGFSFLEFSTSFNTSIIVYLISSTIILVLIDDIVGYGNENDSDSEKIFRYFFSDLFGKIKFLIIGISVVVTAIFYYNTSIMLLELIPEIDESITGVLIGYILLIGQLVFVIDFLATSILSKDVKEKTKEFKGKLE